MTSSLDNKKTTISLWKGHCSQGYTYGPLPHHMVLWMGQPLHASNAQVWKTRGRMAVSQSPPSTPAAALCRRCHFRQYMGSGPCQSWLLTTPGCVHRTRKGYYLVLQARLLHSSWLRYSLHLILNDALHFWAPRWLCFTQVIDSPCITESDARVTEERWCVIPGHPRCWTETQK